MFDLKVIRAWVLNPWLLGTLEIEDMFDLPSTVVNPIFYAFWSRHKDWIWEYFPKSAESINVFDPTLSAEVSMKKILSFAVAPAKRLLL